jgi:hypothetical protein
MILQREAAKGVAQLQSDCRKALAKGLTQLNAGKAGFAIDDIQLSMRRKGGVNFHLFETWQNPDPKGTSLQRTIVGWFDNAKNVLHPNKGPAIALGKPEQKLAMRQLASTAAKPAIDAAQAKTAISKAISDLYVSGDDSLLKSVGAIKLTKGSTANVSNFVANVREMADGMTGSAQFGGQIDTQAYKVLAVDRM